jgi:hypothetical protein
VVVRLDLLSLAAATVAEVVQESLRSISILAANEEDEKP